MTPRSTVAVNLLWLRPGAVGGSEEYLTRALAAFDEPDLALTLFVQPDFGDAHPDVAGRHALVTAPPRTRAQAVRIALEHTWMPWRERGFDLVHHAGSSAPVTGRDRFVVTIHDLQYLTFPEFFAPSRLAYLRAVTGRAVRRAAVVSAPSADVCDRLARGFGVAADRLVEVPHGVDPSLGERATDELEVRSRYRLRHPYVVYPAITHPHKNHEVLLEAFARLHTVHPEVQLVLIGGPGAAEGAVATSVERLGLGEVVVRPGRVPDADRDGLVRHAALLAFPSRYEGFGAPVLEAMHLGAPVVAARSTALPEVVGDAGRLVDPLDVGAWVEAIGRILEDPSEAARLRAAGRLRSRTYTAGRSAGALARAYRTALERAPR